MLKVWDVSTRIYHWLQTLLFCGLIVSAYFGVGSIVDMSAKEAHTWLGTVLSVLLIWRMGWAVFGSETSRFAQFYSSPQTIWRYIRSERQTTVGHNPLGGLMVIILISSLFLQGCLGIMMSGWIDGKDLLGRPTIRTLKQIHEMNALLLITLSSLHVLAAIMHRLKGHHLIRAMFTGNIKINAEIPQPWMASNIKSLAWLVCSGVIMFVVIILFNR